ncbi:MAG: peptidoglycan-N-acetylglucosamine deacetylase [Solirubrobacteraceae bacterium]|nr:peptidoglycan-N-acetylglucosamine deacetylase [Solirubrobacteraceae bacterium]
MSSRLSFHRDRRRVVARRRGLALVALLLVIAVGVELTGSTAGTDRDSRDAMAPATAGHARVPDRPRATPPATRENALEAAAVERVRRRMPFVTGGGGQVREVALTFDDGPGPYTPRLITTLRRLGVPATFFAVGQSMGYFHGATERELRDRFVIGDHTQNHPFMARLAPAAQRDQILLGSETLGLYGVPPPTLYRPPYRSFNAATLRILRRLRLLMVLWTVDTQDYRQPGLAAIVREATRVRPGGIVLMHDGGGARIQTIRALPFIVHKLRRRGFRLVTVPRLMLDDPPTRPQRLPGAGGG